MIPDQDRHRRASRILIRNLNQVDKYGSSFLSRLLYGLFETLQIRRLPGHR